MRSRFLLIINPKPFIYENVFEHTHTHTFLARWRVMLGIAVLSCSFLQGKLSAQCEFFGFQLQTNGFECNQSSEGEICVRTAGWMTSPMLECMDYVIELRYLTNAFTVTDLGDFTVHDAGTTVTVLRHEPLLVSDGTVAGCLTGIPLISSTPFVLRAINPDPPNDVVSSYSFTLTYSSIVPAGQTISLTDLINDGDVLSPEDADNTGQQWRIDGTLEVDTNYIMAVSPFVGGEMNSFAMAPGARIEILAGKELQIIRGDFYGCGGQWDRINIQSGGSLVLGNSFLEDAQVGIEMHDLSNAILWDNKLRYNDTGIGCFSDDPVQPSLELIGGIVFNTIYDGEIGIDFNNAGLLVINQPTGFFFLDKGIQLENTDLELSQVFMEDCDFMVRSNSHNSVLRTNSCNFIEGNYGIYSPGGSTMLEIGNETLNYIGRFEKTGVFKGAGQIGDYTHIANNNFYSSNANISAFTGYNQGLITGNNLDADKSNIALLGLGGGSGPWGIIENEELFVDDGPGSGRNINLVNTREVLVQDNLDMSSSYQNIQIKGGQRVRVIENVLDGIEENIILDGNIGADIICNEQLHAVTGLRVLNTCTRADIKGNFFDNAKFNLAYGSTDNVFATTGPQKYKGNLFDISSEADPKAVNYSTDIIAAQNQYLVDSVPQGGNTYPYFLSEFNQWFDDEQGTDFICPPMGPEPDPKGRLLEAARTEDSLLMFRIDTLYGTEVAFDISLKLFRHLTELQQIDSIPSDLQARYNQLSGTDVHRFISFEQTLEDVISMDSLSIVQMENGRAEVNTLLDSLQQWEWYEVDSIYNLTIDSSAYSHYLDIRDAAKLVLSEMAAIQEAYMDTLQGKLAFLDSLNNAVSTSSPNSVQNLKTANSLLVDRLSEHFSGFDSTAISTLDAIALQCSALGGEGVYLARVLWAEATKNLEREYDDECIAAMSAIPPPEVNTTEESYQTYLAPNPAQSFSIMYLPKENEATIASLVNTQGQILQQFQLPEGQRQLVIPTDTLPAGLYFIQLNDEGISPLKLLVK